MRFLPSFYGGPDTLTPSSHPRGSQPHGWASSPGLWGLRDSQQLSEDPEPGNQRPGFRDVMTLLKLFPWAVWPRCRGLELFPGACCTVCTHTCWMLEREHGVQHRGSEQKSCRRHAGALRGCSQGQAHSPSTCKIPESYPAQGTCECAVSKAWHQDHVPGPTLCVQWVAPTPALWQPIANTWNKTQ